MMGLNYPQRIESINQRFYYGANDVNNLDMGLQEAILLSKERLNEENSIKLSRLICRIELKKAVISFVSNVITLDSIENFQKEVISIENKFKSTYCNESESQNSKVVRACKEVLVLSKTIIDIVKDLLEQKNKLIDSNGELNVNIDDFYRISNTIEQRLNSLTMPNFAQVFPQSDATKYGGFRFVEGVPALNATLDSIMIDIKEAFLSKANVNLDDISVLRYQNYKDNLYVPMMNLTQGNANANIQFVNTPIIDEFDLLIYANSASDENNNLVSLGSKWLSKTNRINKETAAERFSIALAVADINQIAKVFVVYDLNSLTDEEKAGVYIACSNYVNRRGAQCYFIFPDTSGSMELYDCYNRALKAYAENNDVNITVAENKYFALPQFEDVQNVLIDNGFSQEEINLVKQSGVFMGYIGLDTIVKLKKDGNKFWASEMKALSESNESKSRSFISALNSADILVPEDWHWKNNYVVTKKTSDFQYDYDQLRDVRDDVIIEILENPALTLQNKCGKIVQYCLLADEDSSNWTNNVIEYEVKCQRIRKAIRMCAFTMRVYYSDPEVIFTDETSGKWGAYCGKGGAEIVIKKKSIDNYNWLCGTILHELYHSMQRTVTNYNPDIGWYKKVYGLSGERIRTWAKNHEKYYDIDKDYHMYIVQTLETDARDFECLCLGDNLY